MDMWNPNIDDWKSAPVKAYELIFAQAKDRFEDTLSESESITNKAFRILSLLVASIAVLVIFKPQTILNEPSVVLLLGAVFIWDLLTLFILLFPKDIIFRGSAPKEFAWGTYDYPNYTCEDKEKMTFISEIIQYQHKIDFMKKVNESRQGKYRTALILSILVIVGNVVLSIISHPL